ncbi:uncharacterized protein TRIADDRAFT_20429 [Trichoplax adhaerens]|uniref:alpha-1,2-Mannosidase n=1 Tax=Trichoplax adhaerens TaxID=10228 RepID=B3RPB3_TRIAD|nr:hypothetical protein TRIADDRAFT_20429 [Trichoplax adhaerens]EDV28158.1 hypothetical protein TRIADDRAFT_20429 [Trichoplax adhaerens]|eukprot:XP_002109992.1 hypothetical protein TRIADDRAFT_20429 [Trichoplax adhaerens]
MNAALITIAITNNIAFIFTIQFFREKVLEMFYHGYNAYMTNAYPADELMPLSCRGRIRGVEPDRGDIDDALGKFQLTLIDTLDTLAVLGDVAEFNKAVRSVINTVSFDTDIVVSVFETNIRILGGLLGGHAVAAHLKESGRPELQWYNNELLDKAKDIGNRLLPAFNSPTGIPYPRVNLKYGINKELSTSSTGRSTCLSCAGTVLLEFAALSRWSQNATFELKARLVMKQLWKRRQRHSNLLGQTIDVNDGDWITKDSGVGAGFDSYYEYCLKAYILLGDETFLHRFNTHYEAIMNYISQGPMLVNVLMHRPRYASRPYMDALQAFWPGLQVLKGDLKSAVITHQWLYEITKKHNFIPEAFTPNLGVYWPHHPLRPEFAESTYFLYKATRDPFYLEVGKSIVENLNNYARVPCGFAALKDVRTLSQEDRLDSFVFAETFKYLYLLFAEKEDVILPIDNFIFTTEAHLLPLSLSNIRISEIDRVMENKTINFTMDASTCPANNDKSNSFSKFTMNLRSGTTEKQCDPKDASQAINADNLKLKPSDLVIGNLEHQKLLQEMGVQIVSIQDGRLHLQHMPSIAKSPKDAELGLEFMRQVIEVNRIIKENPVIQPRVVQLLSAPHNGLVTLSAGPAQFGKNLTAKYHVRGFAAISNPVSGCTALNNFDDVSGKIVITKRGDCMFIDKARNVQASGAIGLIVIDNTEGSSAHSHQVFAMSGDQNNDIKIPAVFLFQKEGKILIEAVRNSDSKFEILLGARAISSKLKWSFLLM